MKGLLLFAALYTLGLASATADANHRNPRVDFSIDPSPAAAGQTVTFDASASKCFGTGGWRASNCTSYVWHDDADPNDPLDNPFVLGTGRVMSRNFRAAGTKYVWLTVRDGVGRQTQRTSDLVVNAAPPPPPPPPPPKRCANGLDDDRDGLVDLADPGCVDADDDDESHVVQPSPSDRCDRSATPSTFAAEVSAATAGQTVCLASGSYGTFNGVNNAITIKAANGATPTMRYSFGSGDSGFTLDGMSGMGGSISAGASNITVKNSAFNTYAQFKSLVNADIVFDNNTHNDINSPAGSPNARLGVDGNDQGTPTGVTIKNSLMARGDSDGVFVSGTVDILNNEFADLCPAGPNHTDMIQFAKPSDPSIGWGGLVKGNYFHSGACGTQTVSSYDSGTKGVVIEDNVVDTTRPWGIELYSDEGSIVRHNTLRWYPDSQCVFTGMECGQIHITRKTADPPGADTPVYDNVALVSIGSGSTVARNDHNVNPSLVTYVGPLNTYDGFHLAPGSVGKGMASDRLDVGIR
jgi:hypothetical protein